MRAISRVIKSSEKIVIKIGSNVLSTEEGIPNREIIENIVTQLATLISHGKQIILVSSGAGICGVGAINSWSRQKDISYKQALCAIGQVELMLEYKECFKKYGIHVGQILLTRDDFSNDERKLNIRNTLHTLIEEKAIPIINENDSVSVEEIKIGDNDTLSALTSNLWEADALIILSDIDGVFDKDPKRFKDAKLIEEVYDIKKLLDDIDIEGLSSFGTGGISTKIEAAGRAGSHGVDTILLNGKKKNIIIKAIEEESEGTIFYGSTGRG